MGLHATTRTHRNHTNSTINRSAQPLSRQNPADSERCVRFTLQTTAFRHPVSIERRASRQADSDPLTKEKCAGGQVEPEKLMETALDIASKVSTRILGRRTRLFHLSLFITASRVVLPKILVLTIVRRRRTVSTPSRRTGLGC